MTKFFYVLTLLTLLTSCGLLDDDKEPEMLLSEVDGEQYVADMKSDINSRKDTRIIEKGHFDQVSYESMLNIADSLITKNDEWRPRYYKALSQQLAYSDYNIDTKDNMRFGVGIFNYFLFYPKELILQFNDSDLDEMQFWNEQLGLEIKRKKSLESIDEATIISVAQKNCIDCSESELNLIADMVRMLPMQ